MLIIYLSVNDFLGCAVLGASYHPNIAGGKSGAWADPMSESGRDRRRGGGRERAREGKEGEEEESLSAPNTAY